MDELQCTGRQHIGDLADQDQEHRDERDPEDDGGSTYTRTVDGDTASQNYNFDSVTTDEAPIPEPPMPDDDDIPPERTDGGDDFFAQANDSFPDGF